MFGVNCKTAEEQLLLTLLTKIDDMDQRMNDSFERLGVTKLEGESELVGVHVMKCAVRSFHLADHVHGVFAREQWYQAQVYAGAMNADIPNSRYYVTRCMARRTSDPKIVLLDGTRHVLIGG